MHKTLLGAGLVLLAVLFFVLFCFLFEALTVALEDPFYQKGDRKATTARINSQVCSARREMACPAALKMKLTIDPTRESQTITNYAFKLYNHMHQNPLLKTPSE